VRSKAYARERREFIELRLAEAEQALRTSEDRLRVFLEKNRQFRGSPELEFQYERLQRHVALDQEVFTTLRRQYEEARIEEVNDTPLLTIIDMAVPPTRRSFPRRRKLVIISFGLALIIGTLLAFVREFAERARARPEPEFREFTTHLATIRRVAGGFLLRSRRSPHPS
jgi:uncharacterized protein involved in exopolysaccharide biosynthesis